MLVSTAGLTASKLGMKLSRSEKSGTIYVQTSLKETKTPESSVITAADAGTKGMKKETVVDDSGPATSSTLSDVGKTTMNNPVKVMASLYSVYDVDFRKLVEEKDLEVGENLGGKVTIALADPP